MVWFNFRTLHDAVDVALSDPTGTVSEQARFLLRELQALLVEDGLVDSDDVVVVAARFAYPEYLKRGVYVCQAERVFRDGLTHMGFYANSAIQPHVPAFGTERISSTSPRRRPPSAPPARPPTA